MAKVLVLADDVTGGDDIGLMYYKSGHPTVLYPFSSIEKAAFGGCSKLVIDTDSRFVDPREAYERVYRQAQRFSNEQVDQYFSKQCSVFRGNIGAEFDAVLDAVGETFAPVVLGFPDNGRTTLDGIHYVYGTPLAESQFRKDPVNPMRESDLTKILSAQTRRPVCSVSWREYEKGDASLRALLERLRAQGGYAIFDVRDNRDLALLGALLKEERVICGSSAIAYYLGLQEEVETAGAFSWPLRREKVLCIAGSLTPQTAGQIEFAKEKGVPVLTLQTTRLFDKDARKRELCRLKQEYAVWQKDEMVLIRTCSEPEKIAETKELAAQSGLSELQTATAVSDALAELAAEIARTFHIRNVIVCGGDTSASFCRRFDIGGMYIGPEIEPGVPVCASIEHPDLRFVLKSGSFGTRTFLQQARERLVYGEKLRDEL